MKTTHIYIIMCMLVMAITGCSVSYKFNASNIDYTKIHTIEIKDFPIRSSYVWAPMGPMFNNDLKDKFINHTKLSQVRRNGDLKVEGEITNYSQRNKSVSAEGSSAQVELAITVHVRFTNTVNHNEDFDQTFTSSSTYSSTQSLSSVQESLCQEIIKDLIDQIYNACLGQW